MWRLSDVGHEIVVCEGTMSYPVWRLTMDKDVLRAHEGWLANGKSGPGRLVLEGQNLQGARAPLWFPAARFVGCDLSKAAFPLFTLDEIEIIDCKLDDAVLNRTHFKHSQIERTTFSRADLRLAHLGQSRILECGFRDADLERGFFVGTTLEHVNFSGARLVDAVFDDARLVDCDLRGCDMSRAETVLDLARTSRTHFERCDLRGVRLDGRRFDGTVFERCRMDGMAGRPEIVSPYSVIEPVGLTVRELEATWR
jgi:uncharacterized protein YjbI with pentapeptide repeats